MQEVSQAFDFRHEQTPAHSGDWHFAPPHLSTGKGSEIVVSAVAEVAENGTSPHRDHSQVGVYSNAFTLLGRTT